MARQHFCELNPNFLPEEDWKNSYFETILANPDNRLRWIELGAAKVGFILFGLESHRFLPRRRGVIFELYVRPDHRRQGAALAAATKAIAELKSAGLPNVQLEVMSGNRGAVTFWKSLGFEQATERYVLRIGN